jgi:hypothetical protein
MNNNNKFQKLVLFIVTSVRTSYFLIHRGLKEGNALSALLFTVAIEYVIEKAQENQKK